MKAPLILALDIGTSSVRAALYDGDTKLIPRSSVSIKQTFVATADGGSEIRTDDAVDNVVAAIDAVLEKTKGIKGDIEYVASCAFWHSLVGIDANGDHTPVVLGWADRRSQRFSETLKERFDEMEVHNRTGAPFHSSFWPAKLLWLRSEFPAAFSRAAGLLSFSDLLSLRFFGEIATSISMASGTGLFDVRRCDWDKELLKFVKVRRNMLPQVVPGDRTFRLGKKYAKRWPGLKDAEWFPTVADGLADHVGSCGIGKQRASLMVGTSGAMRVAYAGEPPTNIPDGLWCYRIDRKRVIIGGALSDGGNLYALLKKQLRLPTDAEDQMRARGAAAHGLTVLPYFFGERSTGYREDAQGAILGLTASNDGVDILQAAMESVAFRFAEIHDRLGRLANIREIVASGGALRDSSVWPQIIADVLGRDLSISNARESSLRGAVLLALESLGKIEPIDSFSTPAASTLAFHPECHKAYTAARKLHREFDKTISK